MAKAYVEGSSKTFKTGASDIAAGLAVKLSSGLLVVATAATDKILGTLETKAVATQPAAVRLRSAAGTSSAKAGGTIAVGDRITATTDGTLIATTTTGNEVVGLALEAATSGQFFEYMPMTDRY